MKHKKENRGKNLCDLALGKDFLDKTPKELFIKEKTDKLDFIKTTKYFP